MINTSHKDTNDLDLTVSMYLYYSLYGHMQEGYTIWWL